MLYIVLLHLLCVIRYAVIGIEKITILQNTYSEKNNNFVKYL